MKVLAGSNYPDRISLLASVQRELEMIARRRETLDVKVMSVIAVLSNKLHHNTSHTTEKCQPHCYRLSAGLKWMEMKLIKWHWSLLADIFMRGRSGILIERMNLVCCS